MMTRTARGWFLVLPILACFYADAFGRGPALQVDTKAAPPPPHAQQELADAKQGPLAKVGRDLAVVYSEYGAHVQRGGRQSAFAPSNVRLAVTDGRVSIDAVASGEVQALRGRPGGLRDAPYGGGGPDRLGAIAPCGAGYSGDPGEPAVRPAGLCHGPAKAA